MGKQIIGAVVILCLIITGTLSGKIVETNNEGYYQIKQAAVSGEMTVKNTAGMYMQNFGKITTYQVSDMYYFSNSHLDGGSGEESKPIFVRFNDGGTANISGFVKFRLSLKEDEQLALHKDFKNYDAVVHDLIRQTVASSLKQTASLMKAEETYSSRRAEFISLSEDQIIKGIFDTVSTEKIIKDVSGQDFIQRSVTIKTGDDGNPVVKKDSPLTRYHVQIIDFNIKDIDFDSTIDNLIAKKKEAEQQKVVAKANAEKAKQDAITAREQGEARIAQAKAEEEVAKIREVTQALKAKEVAKLNAEKRKQVAELDAQKEKNVAELDAARDLEVAKFERKAATEQAAAKVELAQAEAKKNTLLVKAGLTPLEAAEINMNTKIGVARELAKLKLPQTFIGAGGGSGGAADPFTAIGLESLLKINDRMSGKK
jgi:regulator of protease activity HflC (stomatin/prohibitin superfamily)